MASNTSVSTISPTTGLVIVERPYPETSTLNSIVEAAHSAFNEWRKVPLQERIAILTRFVDHLVSLVSDDSPLTR